MVLESRFVNYHELADALPAAEFVERHSREIKATPEAVWRALHELVWTDLRLTAPLIVLRGLARPGRRRRTATPLLGDAGPVTLMLEREPSYAAAGRVAKPWQPRPAAVDGVDSLAALRAFDEPGWLKYGTDFRLEPLAGGRTRVTTWTRCEPTDAVARRRFRPYWWLIRPFSGLIRRELLRALSRRASGATGPDPEVAPPRRTTTASCPPAAGSRG